MQRILAFLVLLMLPWAVRGQALADWYYWFDADAAPRESGKVSEQQFQLQTDVSHLPTGAHTLYVQVADTAGIFSPPRGTFFFKVPDINSIDKLFYTIDTEEEPHAVDFGNGTFSLDVSTYPIGFHSIRLQVMDKEGGVSSVMPYLFYKVPTDGRLSCFHYWFDNDRIIREQPYGQGHYLLNVSGLIPGLHFVNYFVIDGANSMTDVQSAAFFRQPIEQNQKLHYWFAGDTIATRIDNFRDGFLLDVSSQMEGFNTVYFQMEDNGTTDIQTEHFIKIPQTEGAGDMTVLCIIDGKIAAEEKLPNLGGFIKWNMDVSTMDVGLHKALFQVITPSGAGSSIAETYFLRTLTNAEVATMQCSYIIDGFKHYVQKGTLANGTFHFDLPVSDMEDGLHRMDYMLVAENGATTTQGSAWFFKTPVGGNGITQYDYWLNNKSGEVVSVTLDVPTDPFLLIKLLPVTSEPIRSSCFHFDCKSGKPMMYAKNDIHFRFHDKSGRWVDADNQYVDYRVGKEVKPVGELQATQSFQKVAENDIRWYTMQSAPGDTAAFKLSQAATVQVFAPSGEEVFKTSESASVKWSGIHTWENGTYYLAVHDVTGSQSTMTLEYMHMDKYDVVDWDVHTVGNGGCSTITFKGNGFRDLYAVDLVIAPGDTIHSVDVSHDSDAETSVTFDFTAATLGDYNAVFHFTEEDKPVANVVTVEEAVDIELATDVSFPSSFLRGTSTTYTIKITNKGNMTAYQVPLEMMLKVNSIDDISEISFDGYLKSLSMPELPDSIDKEEIDILQEIVNEANDLCQFVVYKDSISHIDYGMSQVILTLPPYTTKQFIVRIKSSSTIELYAFMTKNWFPLLSANQQKAIRYKSRKEDRVSNFCCVKERWQCAADAIAYVAGFFGGNANCAGATLSTAFNTATDVWCSEGSNISERFNNYVKSQGAALANRLINTLVSCVIGYYKPIVEGLRESRRIAAAIGNVTEVTRLNQQIRGVQQLMYNDLARIYKGVNTAISGAGCIQAWTQKKPNCPPNPNGGGGSSTPVNSCEPNEIYGYVAESGSKAIKEGHTDVFYTIQFENDTVFATAPAHDIYLTDTLDVNLFDLSTYRPTRIKIGEKSMELTGERNFISTMDMRPAINAIAQIEGTINDKNGIVRWHISSLDPMTMEPSDDPMVGVLPVNFDGSGLGEASFEISLKPNLPDGTIIPNRSGNVFDNNETVLTPTWTNIVDAVAPSSVIDNSWMVNDSTLRVTADAFDARSGVWKYEWYVQAGENAPWWKEGETESPQFDYHIFEGIDYGFCVLATDSAGNVEQKVIQRERGFKTYGQDFEDKIDEAPASAPDKEGAIYDLSGRRQAVPKDNQINIIDKKKVLFRRKGQ